MKHLLTAFFVMICFFASAQIVNVPDGGFKTYLLNLCDANGDGEVQLSEALTVTVISIPNVSDITGIRSFVNLQTVNGESYSLVNLDLSGLAQLQSVNFPNDPNLALVNVSGCTNLEFLDCNTSNNYRTMNVIVGNNHKLRTLSLWECEVSELDLRDCDSLSYLHLGGVSSYIGYLNVSGLTKLKRMNDFGKIGSLVARNCPNLTYMNSGTSIAGVDDLFDVTGSANLDSVYIFENAVASFDFSSCPRLNYFKIENGVNLKYVNIKNGSQASYINIRNYPQSSSDSILNICADDFEINDVAYAFSHDPFNNPYPMIVNISAYCSFFPGGNYNTITGRVAVDLDNNGCDGADVNAVNIPIRISDGNGTTIIKYTDGLGKYRDFPYAGNFTLQPYFAYPYFNISPVSANVVFNTANSFIDTTNFCIVPTGVHNDLEITCLPADPARPGASAGYVLVYKNRGNTVLSGNVQLNFDNSKMNFYFSSPGTSSQSPGQLSWNYSNLMPFESRTIIVFVNILAPPINNVGDTLNYLATISPVAGDETPLDNSFILPQRVVASFDPNNKQCLEGNNIGLADFDKYLHYIIHFQNVGNDTAFNIVVTDTLSAKLDLNTVDFIGGSHPCDIKQEGNRLEFVFQNINLPYTAINEPGSHGFLAFKVKPKNNILIGDSLNNKASIYFDFNLPVITNFVSTIVSAAAPVPVKLEYFSVSKKNETHLLTWKAPSTDGSANFMIERSGDGIHFSSMGNITATSDRSLLPFYLTDDKPLTGENYYRLKITDADGKYFFSKILVIGNNKERLEIIAVSGDAGNTNIYVNSDKQQTIQFTLLAADGRIFYNSSKEIPSGNSMIILPTSNVAKGIYTLIAYTNEGNMIIKRFVK